MIKIIITTNETDTEKFGNNKIAVNHQAEVDMQASGSEYEVTMEMVALLDAFAKNKKLDELWLRAMQLHMESMK